MAVTSPVTRLTAALGLAVGALVGGLALPADACACGAYVTNGATSVSREIAALKWDGTTEDLIVSMDILGTSPDAGWIMPVPAQATVALDNIDLFSELEERSAPIEQKVTSWWPNLGFLDKLGVTTPPPDASDTSVQVLEQQDLGDYTVAQLAANDPAALTNWLTANGYQPNDAITAAAAPYAAAGWTFVAAKLVAAPAGAVLTGTLQPIRLTFPSIEPVYPMRLAAAASSPQNVELYVIADHRMDPNFSAVPGVGPELEYAGWLDPGQIGPISPVGQLLAKRSFLMKYEQTITDPSSITGDYTFIAAPSDDEFQAVNYIDRDLGWLTGGLIAVLALIVLAVLPTRIMYRRRVRKDYESREYEPVA